MKKNLFVALVVVLLAGCASTYTSVRNPEMINAHGNAGAKQSDGEQAAAGDLVYERTDWGIFAQGSARQAATAQTAIIEANAKAAAIRKQAEAEAALTESKANVLNSYASNPQDFGGEVAALLGGAVATKNKKEREANEKKAEATMYNVAISNVCGYIMNISITHKTGNQLTSIKNNEIAVLAVPHKNFNIGVYNAAEGDIRSPVPIHIDDRNKIIVNIGGQDAALHLILPLIPKGVKGTPREAYFRSAAMRLLAKIK